MADDTERLVVLLEARIRDFERNMQKAAGTSDRQYGRIRRDSRTATRQMETDMDRATGRINQALAATSMRVGQFSRAFGPIGLAATAATGALTGFAVQAAAVSRGVATIGDEARRAGIGIKAFQELKFVAEQNRVSVEALTDGMKELSLRADEFITTGAGSGAEAFQRLGFTAGELATKLKDPSALFTEIIGKLEHLDRAAQIRIADEVFGGTGGEQFVQLIDEGAAGIRRTIDEANRLGIVMDEELIAKAGEIDRQFQIITQTIGVGLKSAIVEASSAFLDFMDRFNEFEDRQTESLHGVLEGIYSERSALQQEIARLEKSAGDPFADSQIDRAKERLEALTNEALRLRDILDRRQGYSEDFIFDPDKLDEATAGLQTVDQATEKYSKSVEQLRARLTATVSGLQLTIDHFGQSKGAIAAARFEADAMADALRAATAAGEEAIDPKLKDFIQDQAAEYGRLTDQISASTQAEQERQRVLERTEARRDSIAAFEADLQFERSQLGLSQVEQDIRRTLRQNEIAYASFDGQRIAGQMRYIDAVEAGNKKIEESRELARDFTDTLIDGLMSGKGAMGSLIGAFANLNRQLASNALDNLFGVESSADRTAGTLDQILGVLKQQQHFGAPAYSGHGTGTSQTYGAPVGRVERGAVLALSSTASSSVERAGNAFLDLIGRAEGTDKGRGYNESLSYGAYTGGPQNLVSMSLNEIRGLQRQMLAHPANNFNSSALGRYQIVGKTLEGLIQRLDLDRNQLFTPQLQDQLALELARGRGASVSGLRNEWEGFRNVSGSEILSAFGTGVTGGGLNNNIPVPTARPEVLTRSFSDGFVDGSRRIGVNAHIAAGSGMNVGFDTSGQGTGLFSRPGMNVLGAGLGAFAGGYESGSPLGGAVGGALSGVGAAGSIGSMLGIGLAAATPIGMIAGAAAGPIAGKFGTTNKGASR